MRDSSVTSIVAAAAIIAFSVPARAEPACSPVAPEAIAAQWDAFASREGVHANDFSNRYQCLTIDKDRITVCRTTPSNPAHPSIVVRTAVRRAGGWFVDSQAATAGACPAFRAMLAEFDAADAKMGEAFARSRAQAAREHEQKMERARARLRPH